MKLNPFALTLAPLLAAGAFSAHAGPQARGLRLSPYVGR